MRYRIIPVILLAVALLCGCGKETEEIKTLEDMKDKTLTIALADDIDANSYVLEACPNAKLVHQNDVMYGIRSVIDGKVDGYVAGQNYIEKAILEGNIKTIRILDDPIVTYECALGLSGLCRVPEFESTVNRTVDRLISDGIISEMRERWIILGNEQMPEIELDENPTYTLNAVTYGESKPYSFIKNGELTGFDVELLYRVCAENHWGLKLSHAKYEGMLMGLSTGKYDIISADLYVTENRADNVLYSHPYRSEKISVAVRAASEPSSGADDAQELEYSTLSQLENAKTFAVPIGTIGDLFVNERYPQADIEYYPLVTDCALALTSGKVDAVVYDAPTLAYISSCTKGVALMPEYITKDDYHFIMPKSERGEALQKEFNEWLSMQRQNGELDRMIDFWCSSEDPDQIMDFEALPNINGTVRIAASTAGRPDVYYYNNRPTGYPTELIYNFCRDRGYGAEFFIINYDSMIPCLVSGKADFMVSLVSYTEERAQSVLFSDCIYEGGVGVLVRSQESDHSVSFIDTLVNGLRKTFITESRWKLIVSGLGVTFLITVGGFLLANVLGAAFCACAMSKRKGLRILAEAYDRIMQGTPIVVVLMILYYVIFGKSNIDGVLVAIFSFGLASGASLAQQFYGAVSGVDKGQTEAALSIGFTRFEAFTGIVLPQAIRTALPGYFSEIISLMKGTSIVGYIAVTDLTKASDLIRSSTYDAFFPLLSVALIYFLIAFGILNLMKSCQKRLEPKRVGTQEAEK